MRIPDDAYADFTGALARCDSSPGAHRNGNTRRDSCLGTADPLGTNVSWEAEGTFEKTKIELIE